MTPCRFGPTPVTSDVNADAGRPGNVSSIGDVPPRRETRSSEARPPGVTWRTWSWGTESKTARLSIASGPLPPPRRSDRPPHERAEEGRRSADGLDGRCTMSAQLHVQASRVADLGQRR